LPSQITVADCFHGFGEFDAAILIKCGKSSVVAVVVVRFVVVTVVCMDEEVDVVALVIEEVVDDEGTNVSVGGASVENDIVGGVVELVVNVGLPQDVTINANAKIDTPHQIFNL
jgi:hypothetical protein